MCVYLPHNPAVQKNSVHFLNQLFQRAFDQKYFRQFTHPLHECNKDRIQSISTSTGHFPNVVLMLVHRLRRWPNIKTTLGERHVLDVRPRQSGDFEVESREGLPVVSNHSLWLTSTRETLLKLTNLTQMTQYITSSLGYPCKLLYF